MGLSCLTTISEFNLPFTVKCFELQASKSTILSISVELRSLRSDIHVASYADDCASSHFLILQC